MFTQTWTPAVFITLVGLWAAWIACLASFHGAIGTAAICLVIAGLCDLLDGPIARRRPRPQAAAVFGVQIDSLVDLWSFGAVPVIVCLHLGLDTVADACLMGLYLTAAAMRLAAFNTMKARDTLPQGAHKGVAVTYAALVFPTLWLTQAADSPILLADACRLGLVGLAVGFVLPIRVPRPGRRGITVLVFAAVVLLAVWGAVALR